MHAKKMIHWKYMKHRKQIYIVIRLRYFSSSTCLYPMSMIGLWFDCQLYTVGIFYPCSFTIRLCDHKKDMERLMLVHLTLGSPQSWSHTLLAPRILDLSGWSRGLARQSTISNWFTPLLQAPEKGANFKKKT